MYIHCTVLSVYFNPPPLPAPPLKGGVTPFCGLHSTCRWTFCWNGYVLLFLFLLLLFWGRRGALAVLALHRGWVVLLDYCCLKQGQDSKPSGSSTPSFLGIQYLHLNSSETGRSCMYCQTTAMLNKTSSDNFYRIFYFYY